MKENEQVFPDRSLGIELGNPYFGILFSDRILKTGLHYTIGLNMNLGRGIYRNHANAVVPEDTVTTQLANIWLDRHSNAIIGYYSEWRPSDQKYNDVYGDYRTYYGHFNDNPVKYFDAFPLVEKRRFSS